MANPLGKVKALTQEPQQEPALMDSLTGDWQVQTCSRADKAKLRYALYRRPGGGEVKKLLVFLNGRNEFLEKYAYLPCDLELPPGWAFLSWDHRGQGASSGQTSHIDSYSQYAQDAATIISQVRQSLRPTVPYTILAHSMGSLIALYGTMQGFLEPEALILCSPFLGVPKHTLAPAFSRPLAQAMTQLGLGRQYIRWQGRLKPEPFADNQRTHCPKRFARMQQSPYPAKSVSFGWVHASFNALELVFSLNQMAKLTKPITLLAAGQETIVEPSAIARWYEQMVRLHGQRLHLLPIRQARHELLAEIDPYYQACLRHIRACLY